MKKIVHLLPLPALILLSMPACSTYRTEESIKEHGIARSGDLPYFMPKGFIRLRIRPVGGGGGGGGGSAAAAQNVASNNTWNFTVNGTAVKPPEGSKEAPLAGDVTNPIAAEGLDALPPAGPSTSPQSAGTPPPGDGTTIHPTPPQGGITRPSAPGAIPSGTLVDLSKETNLEKVVHDAWLTAFEGLTDYEIEVSVVIRPDKNARRVAHYIPNWLFQETVGLDTDGDHLLKTTETTMTDRTRESLSNLVEAFGQSLIAADGFATLGSAAFFKGLTTGTKDGNQLSIDDLLPNFAVRKLDLDVIFDPTDPEEVKRVKEFFNPGEKSKRHWTAGRVLKVRKPVMGADDKPVLENGQPKTRLVKEQIEGVEFITPFRLEIPVETYDAKAVQGTAFMSKPDNSGLWFRAPKTYRMRVKSNMPAIMEKLSASNVPNTAALAIAKKFTVRDKDLEVAIPDPENEFEWDVRRSAFIEKKVKLIVNQGVLQGFTVNKGSEVEGFTTIPLALARQVAAIPKALVDNRSSLTTGLNTLNANQRTLDNRGAADQQASLKAEQDLIDQQIATEKKKKELQDLLKANAEKPKP